MIMFNMIRQGAILWIAILSLVQPTFAAQPPLKPLGKGLEFPDEAEWMNVEQPLKLQDLRGKLVLLDFWTYCCINCIHVLPVLKQAEEAFSSAVGCRRSSYRQVPNREGYREYPRSCPSLRNQSSGAHDVEQVLWNGYGVNTWPTLVLLDPEGNPIWVHKGEIPYKDLERVLSRAVAKFAKGIIAEPFRIAPESANLAPTPLRFPERSWPIPPTNDSSSQTPTTIESSSATRKEAFEGDRQRNDGG